MQETLVQFLGWEDTLEEGTATDSSILARSPWDGKESIRLSDFHFNNSPFLFGNHNFVFCVFDSISTLEISSFVSFFFDSTYKWYHMIICLCLTSLSMIISRSIHIAANGIISFFFSCGWVIVHCVYIPHLYTFICWWTCRWFPCPLGCIHLFELEFFQLYAQEWDCWIIWELFFLPF